MLRQDGVQASATALAGELARRTGSERVSVGLLDGGHVRLVAISDTARFDARTQLARTLEGAMDDLALDLLRVDSQLDTGWGSLDSWVESLEEGAI